MLVSTMTAGKANNFAIRARSQHLIQKSKPGDTTGFFKAPASAYFAEIRSFALQWTPLYPNWNK